MKFLLNILGLQARQYKPSTGSYRTFYRDEANQQFTKADEAIIADRRAKGLL